ncbi:hypothetical protein JCM10212_001834 [Sporobolomyces blumeae]
MFGSNRRPPPKSTVATSPPPRPTTSLSSPPPPPRSTSTSAPTATPAQPSTLATKVQTRVQTVIKTIKRVAPPPPSSRIPPTSTLSTTRPRSTTSTAPPVSSLSRQKILEVNRSKKPFPSSVESNKKQKPKARTDRDDDDSSDPGRDGDLQSRQRRPIKRKKQSHDSAGARPAVTSEERGGASSSLSSLSDDSDDADDTDRRTRTANANATLRRRGAGYESSSSLSSADEDYFAGRLGMSASMNLGARREDGAPCVVRDVARRSDRVQSVEEREIKVVSSEQVVRANLDAYRLDYFVDPANPDGKASEWTLDGDEIPVFELEYPSVGGRERFALLAPKRNDEYNPIEDLMVTIETILSHYLTPSQSLLHFGYTPGSSFSSFASFLKPLSSSLNGLNGSSLGGSGSTGRGGGGGGSSSKAGSRHGSRSASPAVFAKVPTPKLSTPEPSVASLPTSTVDGSSNAPSSSSSTSATEPTSFLANSHDGSSAAAPSKTTLTATRTVDPPAEPLLRSLEKARNRRDGPTFLTHLRHFNETLVALKTPRSTSAPRSLPIGAGTTTVSDEPIATQPSSLPPSSTSLTEPVSAATPSTSAQITLASAPVPPDPTPSTQLMPFPRLPPPPPASSTISDNISLMRGLREKLWTKVFHQCYDRVVGPDIEELRRYEAFSDNVYGELLPKFMNEIFEKTRLGPGKVFVDLGSGVGNCVVQAALATGADSYGFENMPHASHLARLQLSEATERFKLWGLDAGAMTVVETDFCENPEVPKVLRKADVVLVNNEVFTAALNDKLAYLFLDLPDDCYLVSLKPFLPPSFKLSSHNLNHPLAYLSQSPPQQYRPGSVSWKMEGGTYYIARVERGRLERWVQREEEREEGRKRKRDELRRSRSRSVSMGVAMSRSGSRA